MLNGLKTRRRGGNKIQPISFEDFWRQLRREATGLRIDILFKAGCLEMQWSFSDQETKQRIEKLLKQRGAKYRASDSTVYFWVEDNEEGYLNLVKASGCQHSRSSPSNSSQA